MTNPGDHLNRTAEMDGSGRPLRCVVVEDDAIVREVIALALRGFDVEARNFTSAEEVVQACDRVAPDVVFLDVALQNFDAIDVLRALGSEGYRGAVQLVSGHHSLLEMVQRIGEGNGLTMLAPVAKPFHASALRRAAEGCSRRRRPDAGYRHTQFSELDATASRRMIGWGYRLSGA